MPYKLTGTLIALLFYGCLLNITVFFLSPYPACAQLSELSEIQNGIFFLSHKNMGITSETFKTDKYIDDEQAEYFSEISRPKINTPADGNYPFTLVDHYILDSDLEIQYNYDNILCSAYPQRAYLSRHNISIADYTDTKVPPTYTIHKIRGEDPYTGEKVTAMHLEVNNYENFVAEILQKAQNTQSSGQRINDLSGAEYVRGYVGNTYVRVNSAQVSVWLRSTDTALMKRCEPPVKKTACLHPSDIRPEKKWYIVKTGNIGPFQTGCTQDLPLRPRSQCYYPLQPERRSAAATNWSYNYNIRNASSSSERTTAAVNRSENAQNTDSTCRTCR